jgi:hypothetical protein
MANKSKDFYQKTPPIMPHHLHHTQEGKQPTNNEKTNITKAKKWGPVPTNGCLRRFGRNIS